jgi:hypothetical protein
MRNNIKYKKTFKNKKILKNKKTRRRKSIRRKGGMFRRFAKNMGKTAMDVTTDVLTEVSKDQIKQISKKAINSLGKASATSSFNYNYSKNNETPFKNSPKFVSSPTYNPENAYKIDFDSLMGSPTTPTKKPYFDEDVLNTPIKEKPSIDGSVAVRNADLTEVKKQLF